MKNPITAQRLSLALTNANMIPQELSNASGVNKASISQYLNGSHSPSNISSGKMAQVLNVNPLWLMGFDVPMETQESSEKPVNNDHFQTKDECELVLSYRKLNEQNKKKCSIYTNTLLTNQQMEEELMPNAAHESKKPYTTEERQADEDMLD